MVDARHKAQTIAEGIHTPISFEYANEAARLAAGPFESYDKNKFALQLDTNTIYVLTGTAPIVWGSVSGSSISGDLDMDGYDIVDVGTVDGVDVSSHEGRHESGGADAIEIADLGTSEVNVLLVLQPDGAGGVVWSVPLGGGDVVGPAGATDNAIALFDAGTGKVIKNSLVTIDGAGNISTPGMVDGYALGTEFYDINAQLNILGGILGGDLSGTLPNPTVVDLSITGEEQGSVLYFNGTNWVQLSPGEDGYALITHNTGANPTWGEVASSSPITSVFGRVGDVIAGIDDYSASQIDNDSTVPGGQVSDALEYLDGYVNHATRHENGGPDEIEISNLGTSENNPLLVLQPDGAGGVVWSVPSGGGDVVGPAGATDNAIALFDAGTGKVIKNSLVTIDGSGNISTPGMVDGYVLGAEFYEINAQLDILGGPLGGDLSGSLPNPSVVDLTIIGEEQGSVLYFDGSNWVQLPPGSDGYALITHDTGANPTWGEVAGSAPVTSVFGRVGDVVAATDDYSASQIDNDSTVTGEQVSDALEYLDGYIGSHIADLNNPHQTSIANIGSGTLAELNLAISDATLDDISGTRTPTAHATSHEEGETDAIDGYQIGIVYVPVNYAAPASPIIGAHIAAIDDALASSGLVDSVFGRVGDVVAVTDDYSASQIDNDSTVAGEQVSDALEYLDGYIGDVYTLTVGGDLSGNLPNPTVTDLSITSEEQGSILYFDGSNWVQLPPGEDGYILTTRDTGANPEWAMEVLKLDQTNPQTIINGQPTFNDGLLFGNSPSVGDFVSGKLYYDELWRTLSLESGRDVTLQIGQEEWRRVYNNTGSTILNGKAVYTSGVWNGSLPYVATVGLAIANDAAKWQVLGIATQDIADGYYGFISVRGHINGVNTDAWTAGDVLYLSDTVAGDLSNTVPTSGNYKVRVGRVIRKDATEGVINVRIIANSKLGDLADVVVTSAALDQVLTFNGVEWVNGQPASSSASPGIDFFNSTPVITARTAPAGLSQDGTAGNGIQINSLSKTPVTTAEQTQTILASVDTRAGAAWLYDTALGRATIDAGLWDFTTYAAVSNTGGTNTITRTIYQVVPGTGTLSFTGAGANSRTATITAAQYDGTYFVPSGTQTLASFIQATSGTDRGIYQITAMTDPAKLVATATVRTGYVNETGVTYNIWNRLFSITTVTLTSTSLSQYDTVTSQPAFTIAATDKLGTMMFVTTSGLNRTFTIAYDGTERNTHVSTPLITLHNNLSGLQGGSANERYHISAAQYTVVGNTSGTNTGDNAVNSNYANDYRPGGTDVPVADGGTGLSAIAAGSILAANTANVLSAVTSAVGTTFLKNTAGTVSWGDISASQIDNDSTVPGERVSDALEYLDGYVDHAERHEYGGGDPIDGYQVGLVYSPVNYNPPGTDIIGEHIAAIDVALASAGSVDSVFGRIGDVVAAIDDYSASQIDNDSTVIGEQVSDALEYLDGYIGDVYTLPVGGDLSGTLPNPTVVDLTITSEEQGSVLYFDGSNWVQLPPGDDGYVLTTHDTGANPAWEEAGGSGSGDVVGPAVATDSAIVRYDSSTGKLIQNSGVLVDNSDNVSGVESLAIGDKFAQTGAIRLTNNEGIYWAGIGEVSFPGDRAYKLQIDIQQSLVTGDPVNDLWVRITHQSLPDAMLTSGGSYAPQAGGGDIGASLDEFGLTRIPLYVRRCDLDPNPANSRVQIWVRRQDVSDTVDTPIWLWWGDAAATPPAVGAPYGRDDVFGSITGTGAPPDGWGVWLFDEDPAGSSPQYKDHTGSGHDAAVSGTVTRVDSMDVRGAQIVAGSGWIDVDDEYSWTPGTNDFSILWAGVLGTAGQNWMEGDGDTRLVVSSGDVVYANMNGSVIGSTAAPATASCVGFVRDGNNAEIHINTNTTSDTGWSATNVSWNSTIKLSHRYAESGTFVKTFVAFVDTAVNPYWFRAFDSCIINETSFLVAGSIEEAAPAVLNVRGLLVDPSNNIVLGDADYPLVGNAADSIAFNVDGYETVSICDGYVDVINNDIRNIKTATFNEWPTLTPDEDGYVTVDFSSYQKASIDLNDEASVTITLNEPMGPGNFMLILKQGSTTATTLLTWVTEGSHGLYGPYGDISYSKVLDLVTLIGLAYDGSDWFGTSSQPLEQILGT